MNANQIQAMDRFQELPENPGIRIDYKLRLVAVRGAIGDWAVYAGHPDAADWEIADYGIKLSPEAGKQMFPNVNGRYRE